MELGGGGSVAAFGGWGEWVSIGPDQGRRTLRHRSGWELQGWRGGKGEECHPGRRTLRHRSGWELQVAGWEQSREEESEECHPERSEGAPEKRAESVIQGGARSATGRGGGCRLAGWGEQPMRWTGLTLGEWEGAKAGSLAGATEGTTTCGIR